MKSILNTTTILLLFGIFYLIHTNQNTLALIATSILITGETINLITHLIQKDNND